jgi:hypothetical protein
MSRSKLSLILGGVIMLVLAIWKLDVVKLAGSFCENGERFCVFESEEKIEITPGRSGEGLDREDRLRAAAFEEDAIEVRRTSPVKYIFNSKDIAEISSMKPVLLTQYKLCVTGNTNAAISKMVVDFHGHGEYYLSAEMDGEKLWQNDAGFYTPPGKDGVASLGQKSYTIGKDIVIPFGACRNLNLFVTKIGNKGQDSWLLPLFKATTANLPVSFVENISGDEKKTDISVYKKATNYGYGAIAFFSGTQNSWEAYGSSSGLMSYSYDSVTEIYQKIMTEKIVITSTGSAAQVKSFPKLDIAAKIGGKNPPLLLSGFNVCVKGETPAQVKGIAVHMLSNASFTFFATFGPAFLWKDPIKDFAWLDGGSNYLTKTYDFLFDNPISLSPGSCTPLVLWTNEVNPNNKAGFVLPLIENIGSNLQTEFHEVIGGKTYVRVLGGKDNWKPRGHGAFTLFHETPGPVYLWKSEKKTYTYNSSIPGNFYNYLWNYYGNPVKIKKLNYVVQANYKTSLPAEVILKKNFNSSTFGEHSFDSIETKILTGLTLPTNSLISIPADITLNPLEELVFRLGLTFPFESATYIPRLVSIETESGEVWMISSGNIFSLLKLPIFTGMDHNTYIINKPGAGQPGPVEMYGQTSEIPNDPPPPPDQDPMKYLEGKSGDPLVKAAKNVHALQFYGFGGGAFSHTAVKKMLSEGKPLVLTSFDFQPYQYDDTYQYLPKKIVMSLKTNLKGPITLSRTFWSGNKYVEKTYTVMPAQLFDVDVPAFSNGIDVLFYLKEYPQYAGENFYIEPVLHKAEIYSGPKDGKPGVFPTPILKGEKPLVLPWNLPISTFSGGGLYESKNFNVPPPFKEIVDILKVKKDQEFTMNNFCALAKEKVTIKSLVFDHVVRDTSPFDAVTLSIGWSLTELLQKSGWSKHLATFSLSSPHIVQAGNDVCFKLKVKGPQEEVEGAYFDLIELKAVGEDGKAVPLYLKNEKELSDTNRIKGTPFDFL